MNFDQAIRLLQSFWAGGYWKCTTHTDRDEINEAFTALAPLTTGGTVIGAIDHPVHGMYFIHCVDGLFGVSRDTVPIHCGYLTLYGALSVKGL